MLPATLPDPTMRCGGIRSEEYYAMYECTSLIDKYNNNQLPHAAASSSSSSSTSSSRPAKALKAKRVKAADKDAEVLQEGVTTSPSSSSTSSISKRKRDDDDGDDDGNCDGIDGGGDGGDDDSVMVVEQGPGQSDVPGRESSHRPSGPTKKKAKLTTAETNDAAASKNQSGIAKKKSTLVLLAGPSVGTARYGSKDRHCWGDWKLVASDEDEARDIDVSGHDDKAVDMGGVHDHVDVPTADDDIVVADDVESMVITEEVRAARAKALREAKKDLDRFREYHKAHPDAIPNHVNLIAILERLGWRQKIPYVRLGIRPGTQKYDHFILAPWAKGRVFSSLLSHLLSSCMFQIRCRLFRHYLVLNQLLTLSLEIYA